MFANVRTELADQSMVGNIAVNRRATPGFRTLANGARACHVVLSRSVALRVGAVGN